MEQQKVDFFIMTNGKNFPPEALPTIRQTLLDMDDNKAVMFQGADYRDPTLLLVLSILVGELGVDRFMLGDTGLGVLKLLTAGGCGIWWLIDLFSVQQRARRYNYQLFQRYMMM